MKHEGNDKYFTAFTRAYNSNHQFPFNEFKNCIKNTANRTSKSISWQKILVTTPQPKKLRNMLTKFATKIMPISAKLSGLLLCNNCVFHNAGYTITCSSFN